MTIQHEPATQDPTQRPARLALYLGLFLVTLGFVVLFIGYNGAANDPHVEAQMPYLISGGIFGLGLLFLGGIGVAAGVVLRVTGELRAELHETRAALGANRPIASNLETTALPTQEAPTIAKTNGHVVVSSSGSSFHKPECRLVERVEAVSKVGRSEATASGFAPCRICNP